MAGAGVGLVAAAATQHGRGTATGSTLPLAVDMDGTLIRDDTTYAAYRRLVLRRPWLLIASLVWLMRGLHHIKAKLADRWTPDPSELPFHADTLAWLAAERASGNRPTIVLCSASEVRIVRAVADHVGLFDDVMATDGPPNLRKQAKRDALIARFGRDGFSYAGNSSHDLHVWEAAGEVVAVNCRLSTLDALTEPAALELSGVVLQSSTLGGAEASSPVADDEA